MNIPDNPFGNLDDFKPDSPAQVLPVPSNLEVQAVAEDTGFGLNNYPMRPIAAVRRRAKGPLIVNKTFRVYLSDANKFQSWLNECGYTQKEGFAILAQNLPLVGHAK
jgi:hypothetical protein